MKSPQEKPALTLEDLLHLKRAERPPDEFWSEFDRDLRARQLAAIVEPRPWWAPLIRIGARFSRYQLPVGAAAILTVSFLTVREYRTTDIAPSYGSAQPALTVSQSEPVKSEPVVVARAESTAPAAIPVVTMPAEPVAVSPAPVQTVAADLMPRQATAVNPPRVEAAPTVVRPSVQAAHYLVNNLPASPVSDSALGGAFALPVRGASPRQAMREPLAQVTSPSETRLARLLATSLPAGAGVSEAALRSNDRVTRSLTEDRLYDTISRISARGAGVAVKF